jgi:nucleoside triphosphate pyrophosphatase
MEIPSLILASASPRRMQLLADVGVEYETVPSNVDETVASNEEPWDYATRMAKTKAKAVSLRHTGRWVLGADTIVVVRDEFNQYRILGKPATADDAFDMLKLLSGRGHQVTTGVAFVRAKPNLDPRASSEPVLYSSAFTVSSRVIFRDLEDWEIKAYVNTGEPMDKAGAYAIQGGASKFVTRIKGSWTNIVGLPVEEVLEWLRKNASS